MTGLGPVLKRSLADSLIDGFLGTDLALAEWLTVDGVSLIGFPEWLPAELTPLYVPEKLPARPKRTGQRKKEGLLWMIEEPLNRWGACPGGDYGLVSEVGPAVKLLTHWAEQQAWAAVDLETGVGIRERLDPLTGQMVKSYVAGSDPFTSPILLCSVSVEPGIAIVFDMRALQGDPGFVKAFTRFLTEARLVCHSASFEQGFFRAQFGCWANIVFDTLLVHQLLTAGSPGGSDLESVLAKYEGLELEKRWQKFFIQIHPESPLPNEAISYSAGDVCRLLSAAAKIDTQFLASGQYHLWTEVERPFMRWVAEAIHTGVATDRELLTELLEKAEIERDTHLARFQALAPAVLISSWQQLLPWFAERDVRIPDTQDETLKGVIARQPAGAAVAQAAEAILSYRAAAKVASTYIEPYLTKLVNPATGRIHPSWKQASTVTGRMACAQPNFQNIPSHGEYTRIRNALVAPPGMKLAWLDYSQFEVRALADAANEPKMLTVFREAYQVNQELEGLIEQHGLPFSLESLTELPQKRPLVWHDLQIQHPALAPLVQRAYECDFHRRTAATLFKKPVNEITKEERAKAKCFHPDTEVLTRTGWKRILELQAEEEVIQALPGADGAVSLEWTVPLEVFSLTHDSGQLIQLRNQGIDLRVTPDHRMLTWTAQGHVKVRMPAKFNRAYYWANAGELTDKATVEVVSPLLQLAVAVQADGSYTKTAIRFGFTRQRKVERLEALLAAASVPYTRSCSEKGVTTFRVCGAAALQIKALLDDKQLPWWWLDLPREQRALVLDEVAYWDATQLPEKRFVRVTSAQDQNLDVLQALGALTGRKSRISHAGSYPNLSLKDHALSRGGNVETTVLPYTEKVACLSVPSTFVLVRDRGVAVITGQTITFALPYGAGPRGVAEQAKITLDEAKTLIREYERTFPMVKRFLELCKQQGKSGRTQTAYGRIRQYHRPNELKLFQDLIALAKAEGAEKKWQELVTKWETDEPRQMAEKMAKAQLRAIEREATNQPIQGANADATKLATVIAAPQLKALHPDCTVLMWVHDEICIQAPAEHIHPAMKILKEAMVAGAERFITRCPIEVSAATGDCWGK